MSKLNCVLKKSLVEVTQESYSENAKNSIWGRGDKETLEQTAENVLKKS